MPTNILTYPWDLPDKCPFWGFLAHIIIQFGWNRMSVYLNLTVLILRKYEPKRGDLEHVLPPP